MRAYGINLVPGGLREMSSLVERTHLAHIGGRLSSAQALTQPSPKGRGPGELSAWSRASNRISANPVGKPYAPDDGKRNRSTVSAAEQPPARNTPQQAVHDVIHLAEFQRSRDYLPKFAVLHHHAGDRRSARMSHQKPATPRANRLRRRPDRTRAPLADPANPR